MDRPSRLLPVIVLAALACAPLRPLTAAAQSASPNSGGVKPPNLASPLAPALTGAKASGGGGASANNRPVTPRAKYESKLKIEKRDPIAPKP